MSELEVVLLLIVRCKVADESQPAALVKCLVIAVDAEYVVLFHVKLLQAVTTVSEDEVWLTVRWSVIDESHPNDVANGR